MDIFSQVAQVVEREERSHQTQQMVNQKLAQVARLRQMASLLEQEAFEMAMELVDYDEIGDPRKAA